MQWVAVVAVWKSQDGSVHRRCDNRKVVRSGAVQVHWLPDRGVRLPAATSPFPQLPLLVDIDYGPLLSVVGVLAFLLWLVSLVALARRGQFNHRSEGNDLWDIVYLSMDQKRAGA